MKALRRILLTLLAAIFLLETWIWDAFAAGWRRIGEWIPFADIKAAVARFVSALPPYAALVLFAIPGILVLPFKLAGLWLIAHGHIIAGGAVFFAAKVASVGVAAFLFELTRDKLMTLGWFARVYATVMGWRDWAHRIVDPYKREIKQRMGVLKGTIVRALASERGQLGRAIRRLRDRIRKARGTG